MVEGFKHTDIGLIPTDWAASDIKHVIDKSNGIKIGPFGSQLKKELLTNSGYKVYGQENVYDNNMEVGDRYISKEHFKKLNSCEIKAGDFLISMMGTIGKCMIVPGKFEAGIMDSHLIRLRLDKEKLSSELLLHFFSSQILNNQVKKFSVGGIMDGLSSKIVKQIQLPLPPTKAEQTAIATALNDADALIQKLEQLIAKKRNIKTGAMQELLKPKEGWEEKKLGEVLKSTQLGGNYANTLTATAYPLIKMGNLQRGYISLEKREYVIEAASETDRLHYGDVLFNTRNTLELVGKVAIWRNELAKAYFNSNIMRLKFNEDFIISSFFVNSLFNMPFMLQRLKDIATGTTSVAAIYTKDLIQIDVPFPNKCEQIRIAQILSDMDNEIQELERQLEKYKMMKQGMMQSLLTGKIRLV